MIDLKNTIMLMSVFRLKFVFWLIALVATVVYISIWILSAYL